ncbi:Ltp family lipoprotein [Kandleria vitulina]|uniref:Ltp family lipoprotein n=1 Tax=Kandleria vitulina TaxID=1630 RepID=UPI000942286F|nr:Ltp family lipoprotein [Kandleria vitulina]
MKRDAQYAVDHCGADWYEQAYKCAKGYMEDNSLSRSELIDQLIYEGYSPEQAIYGVDRVFR